MNLSLAFFHGEQAFVSLLFAALIALLGFPLLVYVWLRHTKLSERIPALVYFMVTASACVIVLGAEVNWHRRLARGRHRSIRRRGKGADDAQCAGGQK